MGVTTCHQLPAMKLFTCVALVASAQAAPQQLHSHHGLAPHPVATAHPGFHTHDGLAAHPIATVHAGFHAHDGLAPHPIATVHPGFHSHDGLAPHPEGTVHATPPTTGLLSTQLKRSP